MKTKASKPQTQANWKIRPTMLRRLNQACLDFDVIQPVLAEMALDALEGSSVAPAPPSQDSMQRPDEFQSGDLTVMAKDADEKRILTAVLMLLRDRDICPVHKPILEALLAPELEELDGAGDDDNGDPDEEEGVA
jgi:hypothetical protein